MTFCRSSQFRSMYCIQVFNFEAQPRFAIGDDQITVDDQIVEYLVMMSVKRQLLFLIFAVSCFRMLRFMESKSNLLQEEVEAIQEITISMGARNWKFDGDPCETQTVGVAAEPTEISENSIGCDCTFENNTVCHVVRIVLKGYSLPGVLPPELIKLPYLKEVDFAYNYLEGTIPNEWASMQLTSVSVLVNRLSGQIPEELGNITSLMYLCLEANRFSGAIPPELGHLINLNTLLLSSNQLTGNLPLTFSGLRNLTDFRINDNNFSGNIPEFIQNWKQLKRLELHASGLKGPILPNISLLNNMVQLRISDIKGPGQSFPMLGNMTGLEKLVLRSCNLSGEIPAYIWTMKELVLLDISFNELVGEIPPAIGAKSLKLVFLTGNLLSGDIPDSILREGGSIDLSYNNFTWQSPRHSACRPNMNLHVNLFQSSKLTNDLRGVLPCSENNNLQCPRYSNCFHVNCGGSDANIKENKQNILYEGDGVIEGGAAKYYISMKRSWGLSSTGDFMDDDNYQNTRYTASLPSSNITDLEKTARISPLSLTYFFYCLENGKYNVSFQFAEILFRNDSTFNSLGRRLFDTYVQEKIVLEDFNIEEAAGGVQKLVIREVVNVSVTSNILEVRFHWSGRGTTRIPRAGVYGPMISAISVVHESKVCYTLEKDAKSGTAYIIGGITSVIVVFLVLIVLGIFRWKGIFLGGRRKKDSDGPGVLTRTFTLKQIKAATNDFDYALKIGEGGFGPVYKGELPDGRVIAVKQLSSKSRQGNHEFLNEIGMISCLQHPNLVKLHGCCIEGDQLMLVYEYMENNNLARALFNPQNIDHKLDWPVRLKICIGIAKGLAFLHEESTLKIVHRDIKATNVLLDKNLNAKISDFGLAKLYDDERTHVSTRVAGTIGYMAPEYALWGHLSYKADVYSFGVLALEIVSGKNNNNYMPTENFVCLLDKAYHLQQIGRLMEIIDEELKPVKEAEVMVKVALLCTNVLPSNRPTMSEVASMLEGRMPVPDTIPEPISSNEDLRFRGIRDLRQEIQNPSSGASQTQSSAAPTLSSSSSSRPTAHEINPEPSY